MVKNTRQDHGWCRQYSFEWKPATQGVDLIKPTSVFLLRQKALVCEYTVKKIPFMYSFSDPCLRPNFHIHVLSLLSLVSERFIYSQDRSIHISCSRLGSAIVGIYKSLTDPHECGNWDCGRAKFLLWGYLFGKFSVLCSVLYKNKWLSCSRIGRSITDTWICGTVTARNSFSRNICFEFSVQCTVEEKVTDLLSVVVSTPSSSTTSLIFLGEGSTETYPLSGKYWAPLHSPALA